MQPIRRGLAAREKKRKVLAASFEDGDLNSTKVYGISFLLLPFLFFNFNWIRRRVRSQDVAMFDLRGRSQLVKTNEV